MKIIKYLPHPALPKKVKNIKNIKRTINKRRPNIYFYNESQSNRIFFVKL